MARVLLVVVALAAPVLAAAQGVGQVLFANDRVSPNTINALECDPANNTQVLVRWIPAFINGNTSVPVGGTYVIYGSNTAPISGTQCQFQDNLTIGQNVRAGTVLNTNSSVLNANVSLSALLAVSGYSCANDGATVYVCVQGVRNGANNMLTNFGIATAAVTISTSLPQVPVITGITPGDGALDVSWEPGTVGSGAAITQQVEIEVEPVGTTTGAVDTGGLRSVGTFGASPARVEGLAGLVNNVIYDVRARALSDAGNPSAFSPAGVTTGMPQAWAGPAPAGGGGGCSSGLAGPFGLAILAGAIALARTGRRR